MGKAVLVVDDDAMNQRMASMILKKAEYEVLLADSGEKALEVMAEQKVDLVLLDIEMPGMNGIETLEKIRENEKIARVPVVFLTGTIDDEIKEEQERLHALDCIEKPFLPPIFLEKVKNFCTPV